MANSLLLEFTFQIKKLFKLSKMTKITKKPKLVYIKVNISDLRAGMPMEVKKTYHRNGETQLLGFVNGNSRMEEVPAVWTTATFQ